MKFNREIIRKYDIRGRVEEDLTPDAVRRLGWALGGLAEGGVLAVGRDCRPSGERLFSDLAAGASPRGCRIMDLGMQTTPMTYFAAHRLEPDVTVMITGSHNPPEYNGFKIMKGRRGLWGPGLETLGDEMEWALFTPGVPDIQRVSVREDYLDRLRAEFTAPRSLKVVVDPGNGTGGDCAVAILEELGHRVVPLFCEPDGTFPNHHPDPTVLENLEQLRETVLREKADLGIAFDGDADRLGLVDEQGGVVFGDRILCVLAGGVLKANPGAVVISEVKASRVFFQEVSRLGGRALMVPTGHTVIKEAMARENALLAGEMSGHIFFRDRYFGYDDALYAALRFLETACDASGPVSSLTAHLPRTFTTPEIREDCPDGVKFRLIEAVGEILRSRGIEFSDIDGVRASFPEGWGLVRASNTQPVLVMRFEAETPEKLAEYESYMREVLREAWRVCDETHS